LKKKLVLGNNLAFIFEDVADKTIAEGQIAYLKNQFDFFGIKTAERRLIFKEYLKANFPQQNEIENLAKELFAMPQREFHYCAIELLIANKKNWQPETIELFEYLIITNSWWDTVDFVSAHLVAPYFKKFTQQKNKITKRWNQSNNMWLQRVSIIFQNKYKKETDLTLLTEYILSHTKSKEFFIQKAIGWALREYAYTDSDFVINFVQTHEMANLSKREALKNIS
jgi:3-methyladenine DNA glycosylase AlkD